MIMELSRDRDAHALVETERASPGVFVLERDRLWFDDNHGRSFEDSC